MTPTTAYVTAEELLRMPHPSDKRIELVKGEIVAMPPAGFDHGARGGLLHGRLWQHVFSNALGIVPTSDTGYVLTRDPDTVRQPDVSFVSSGRLPKTTNLGFFEGAPDLAVEVLSPSDGMEETEEKVEEYLSAGCRLVWVVAPRRRTVTVYRPNSDPTRLKIGDTLSGEGVVPGFAILLSELFA